MCRAIGVFLADGPLGELARKIFPSFMIRRNRAGFLSAPPCNGSAWDAGKCQAREQRPLRPAGKQRKFALPIIDNSRSRTVLRNDSRYSSPPENAADRRAFRALAFEKRQDRIAHDR